MIGIGHWHSTASKHQRELEPMQVPEPVVATQPSSAETENVDEPRD